MKTVNFKFIKCNFFVLFFMFFLFCLSFPTHAVNVTLAWDENNPLPEGYRIYQRVDGENYNYNLPSWVGQNTTCTISNLNENVTYFFVVRAFLGTNESKDSNEVTFIYNTPPVMHTIFSSSTLNGSISPLGTTTVAHGGNQTYTIVPDTNYHIADVLVNEISMGAISTYTFTQVTSDQIISAVFVPNIYTITAISSPNGNISPSGTTSVSYGESKTYTITPNAGYKIENVLVNGNPVGALSTYTFSQVMDNHTITASFTIEEYTIVASAGTGGSISPDGTITVPRGSNQSFFIQPDTNYAIQNILIDGISTGITNNYTFYDIAANHSIDIIFTPSNKPPYADAGPDQTVEEAQWVTLNGLNSHDPDDGIASYYWRQIEGPQVALINSSEPLAKFFTPDVGIEGVALVFELSVTDYSGLTNKDTCIVNVIWVNTPPVAQAGAYQIVQSGEIVLLDASNSVDLDDGIASYYWLQTSGPIVELSDQWSVKPNFLSPDVGSEGASLRFELLVTDNGGLKATDTCVVNVVKSNEPPVAQAGLDQEVLEGEKVFLDGRSSSDPDDGIALYRWKQISGPPVDLFDSTAEDTFFIAPNVSSEGVTLKFQLTVTDYSGLEHDDSCLINVLRNNRPPIASAGNDQIVEEEALVKLDGTLSSDPDDGISAYIWSQISGPVVSLSDPTSIEPTFIAPSASLDGTTLTFELTVIDYSGLKSTDTCMVNVISKNQPPTAIAGDDQTANQGDNITLDGSRSWDIDDGIAYYQWRQISGEPVSLKNSNSAIATFKAPNRKINSSIVLVFELTVTDKSGLESTDSCAITVIGRK